MVTFEQLDKRAQLALSIMAAELTYATNRIVAKSFDFRVYNADKFRLYYNDAWFTLLLWRESSQYAFGSVTFVCNGDTHKVIVENYFKGVKRDTLELRKTNATFEDYLNLANNFKDKAISPMVDSFPDGFDFYGLKDVYNSTLSEVMGVFNETQGNFCIRDISH
jgi:hypothetical protein